MKKALYTLSALLIMTGMDPALAQTVIRDRTMDRPVVTEENTQPDDMAEVDDSDIIDDEEDDTEVEDNEIDMSEDNAPAPGESVIIREDDRTIIIQPSAEDYRRIRGLDTDGNTMDGDEDDDESTVVLSDEEQAYADFADNNDLSDFVRFLETANLDEILQTGASYTIFAPTNAAFRRLKLQEKDRLNSPSRIDDMRQRMAYHIVPGLYYADELPTGPSRLNNLEGGKISLRKGANNIHVENGRVRSDDLEYGHLLVHKIDAVLTPSR